MSIEEQLAEIVFEINRLRQIEYILRSDDFKKVYNGQTLADYYVKVRDVDSLREWVRIQGLDNLSTKTVVDLRKMAATLGMKNYPNMNKQELIQGIKRWREMSILQK